MKIKEIDNDSEHREQLAKTGYWGRRGAGCLLQALDTGKICIAHRSDYVEEPGTWGTWGGAIDGNESPKTAARREVREEAGYNGKMKLLPMYVFKHSSGFTYYNFLALVDSEFTPKIDWESQDLTFRESQGYAWVEYGDWPTWPTPLHPGLKLLLADPASINLLQKYSK